MRNPAIRLSNLSIQAKAELEDHYLKVLQYEKDKFDACRELAHLGTEKSVEPLAALLTDKKLSHMARYALEPNPSPKVDTVLRKALKKVDGDLLIGVIGSVGVRKDKEAVNEVSAYLNNSNQGVVEAAARSLGSIGTDQAAKAISKALPKAKNPQVKLAMIEGLLRCADTMEAQDQKNQAQKIYKQIQKSSPPDYIQSAVQSRT